jgi:Cu-Zn family superoxide dismutase
VQVREAVAVLVPTKGSRVSGVVRFRTDGPGTDVEVTASVDGLPAGAHAYHVHIYGDCSAPDAQSAGPHFHFVGSSFEEKRFITGDLGELRADGKTTTAERGRIHAMLQGRYSILGRAVVVHEKGNDPASPPDGAAGKRLACGVIGVANQGPGPGATASAADPYHP